MLAIDYTMIHDFIMVLFCAVTFPLKVESIALTSLCECFTIMEHIQLVYIYGTMSFIGGAMNSVYGTMTIIGGTMSNGKHVCILSRESKILFTKL